MSLLESYLENREQCVTIDESKSEPTALQYGVLQGSVLGPVLFTARVGKLQSAGHMRPAKGIHAALQMLVNLEEKVTNFRFNV